MKKISIIILSLAICVLTFSQSSFNITPVHAEVCGGDVFTYSVTKYMYPSNFTKYVWDVVGGKFANGQTTYTVYSNWNNQAVVTWSNVPQSEEAYLRCKVVLEEIEWVADIEPAIYAVPKPNQIDPGGASSEIIVLTSSSSVELSTDSDDDWWVDDYRWVFDPVSGTTDTYFPSTETQTISLDNSLENGQIRVQTYNDHCNSYSAVRSATLKRKLVTPTWNTSYTLPTTICNSASSTIAINAVPLAQSYTYTATGGIEIFDMSDYSYKTTVNTIYTSVGISAPSSGSGSGSVSVVAHRYFEALSSDDFTVDIWVDVPPKPSTSPTESEIFEMELGDDDGFYVTNGPQATSYLWTISGSIMAITGTTSSFVLVTATSLGEGDWTVKSVNGCGQSIAATGLVDVVLSGDGFLGPLSVYPIPANSFLILEADETKFDTSIESLDSQLSKLANGAYLRIIDKFGTVKLTQVYNGERKVQINTSTLDPGLYTLQLVSKEGNYSVNISISR